MEKFQELSNEELSSFTEHIASVTDTFIDIDRSQLLDFLNSKQSAEHLKEFLLNLKQEWLMLSHSEEHSQNFNIWTELDSLTPSGHTLVFVKNQTTLDDFISSKNFKGSLQVFNLGNLSLQNCDPNSLKTQIFETINSILSTVKKFDNSSEKKIGEDSKNLGTEENGDEEDEDLSRLAQELSAIHVDLGNITTRNLSEILSLRRPPAAVEFCMKGVCLCLTGKVMKDFNECRVLMKQRGFIKMLLDFDPKSIKPKLLKHLLKTYIGDADDHSIPSVRKSSAACGVLMIWLQANIRLAQALAKNQ